MFRFAASLTPDDNGTVMVSFADVPEAVTFGDDEADALLRAADALETALAGYIDDRRDIPESVASGKHWVSLSLLASLKLETWMAMRAKGWRKADLARAMAVNPRQIDRLFDLHHATPVAQLEQALTLCDRRLELRSAAA